eukprot:6206842-Pleurochrysis_carterae.AAC.5
MATIPLRLREGDEVSMPVATFKKEYARSQAATAWTSPLLRNVGRIEGQRNYKRLVNRPASYDSGAASRPGATLCIAV